MTGIALYVEGGGDTADQHAQLRVGFEQLFTDVKQAARARRFRWKIAMCGSRNEARDAFLHAWKQGDPQTLCVLVVDSEENIPPERPVPPTETAEQTQERRRADAIDRRDHLIQRDHSHLQAVPPEQIHLMVPCMEAWIAADPAALAQSYGKNFRADRLPDRPNLEDETKASLLAKLARATQDTTRGPYSEANKSKIRHAHKLLAHTRAAHVAQRCPRFATLIRFLSERIAES